MVTRSDVYTVRLPEDIPRLEHEEKRGVVVSGAREGDPQRRVHIIVRTTHRERVDERWSERFGELKSPKWEANCNKPAVFDCAIVTPVATAGTGAPVALLNRLVGARHGSLPDERMRSLDKRLEDCLARDATSFRQRLPPRHRRKFGQGWIMYTIDRDQRRRPVMVVSSDRICREPDVATVVPLVELNPTTDAPLLAQAFAVQTNDSRDVVIYLPLIEWVRTLSLNRNGLSVLRDGTGERIEASEDQIRRVLQRVLAHLGVHR